MKVHLIYTPDVHPQLIDEVEEILKSVSGPIVFGVRDVKWKAVQLQQVNQQHYRSDFRFLLASEDKIQPYREACSYPLSWRELFFLCEQARMSEEFSPEDFVILITNRRNSMNYFSMFDTGGKKNAFVQSSDWDVFLKASECFPVAYEVVANLLRILMKFDLSENMEVNFHMDSIGCMNDFCENKSQIILKLRTADLCLSCLQRLDDNGVASGIIMQSLAIFEKIRSQLKFSQGLSRNAKPKKLTITDKGKIQIGELELRLTPLEKTIWVFFLSHPEGIRLAELDEYEMEIFSLYQLMKIRAARENIQKLVDNIDGNFSYNKSRLNKKIRDQIGEPLAHYYCITGIPGEKFSIPLERTFVSMPDDFQVNQA